MPNNRPTFQMSIDTRAVYERLVAAKIEEIIKYEDLSALIGRDIRSPQALGCLTSARRAALHQNRLVFGTIRKVGVKRLSDAEIVETGEQVVNYVRNSARRCVQRLTVGVQDFDKLPAEMQIKHNSYVSLASAIAGITKPGAVKQLESRVAQAKSKLPLMKTLEAFRE